MTSTRRAFVIMPFGEKKAPDGTAIDFDAVYQDLFAPAIAAAGLMPHRADADRRGGSIHLDMFQDLLLAEFVVADLTLDNPNVWYEIGVRHALRAGGAVLTFALRDRLPFDIAGQRMQRYTLKGGRLDPDLVEAERNALKEAIEATLGAWRGRRASPVYQQLPNLREPDWKTIKVGDVNEFWQALEAWQSRVEVARRKQRPGDILVLAEETPNSVLEFEALRTAARALVRLSRPRYALNILERARQLEPDDVEARQLEGIALGRAERYAEARESLRRLAEERKDGETLGLLARTWKDEWTQIWNAHPQRKLDPVAAARDTAATLQSAASAYIEAFRAAPGDYYPGINALTLGRLWEHVTGRHSRLPLDLIAAGVGWTAAAAAERNKDYWSLATRAELALIENRKDDAIDDYSEAAALAVANRDWFALELFQPAARFSRRAKISKRDRRRSRRRDRSRRAAAARSARQPSGRAVGAGPCRGVQRSHDRQPGRSRRRQGQAAPLPTLKDRGGGGTYPRCARRGRGRRRRSRSLRRRFRGRPAVCRSMPRSRHADRAASGSRRKRVPRRVGDFCRSGPSLGAQLHQVTENPGSTVLVMPEELGPAPAGVSVHDRCNRWMLYSALSQGLRRASFITLWNGEAGDGPGGTQNMVELVRKLTGRQPIIIDPATL